jgi:hypothetical protein
MSPGDSTRHLNAFVLSGGCVAVSAAVCPFGIEFRDVHVSVVAGNVVGASLAGPNQTAKK